MQHFLFILLLLMCNSLYALPLQSLKLPPGFHIEVLANVDHARQLARGNQAIFVGSVSDKVFAIIPEKNKASAVITIAKDLNYPNGVAFYEGDLYVAEIHRILRYDNIEAHLEKPPKPVVIAHLPNKMWHGFRVIAVGPDKKLYVGVGAPCNVCIPNDPIFGTILRMNLDGSQREIFAKGIRNTVGFDWDPRTHNLWFTDNGADMFGDDIPPDELNYAPNAGMHFGFPHVHGKNILDPTHGKSSQRNDFTPPALELPAHVAALGMKFYSGSMFPAEYRNQVFIAEHGSWNRSEKVGYQVISAQVNNGQANHPTPFVSGWLQGEKSWGRPVDILVMLDGSLLISDDVASVVYRVSYQRPNPSHRAA